MAKREPDLEPEVISALNYIKKGQNFLVSGGAGSGKTFSLVQTIRQFIIENPTAKIACITYTNAAVKQIEERINHQNLQVSTIHNFLWSQIHSYQSDLKSSIISLANNPNEPRIAIENDGPIPPNFFDELVDGITYREYARLARGIISHDEVLVIAEYLFRNRPKLNKIVQDKFRLIVIDEYQDTDPLVTKILLEHFTISSSRSVIGFFGDAMQSIYPNGVGNLNCYKEGEKSLLKEIKKSQNRRNPLRIITLANKLRIDGITQVPSKDENAPNMDNGKIKEGTIKFLFSGTPDIELARSFLRKSQGWNFKDSKRTKELNLTHNLIADKAGFRKLMDIYDKDRILQLKGRVVRELKEKNVNLPENATFGDAIQLCNIQPSGVIKKFIDDNRDLYIKATHCKFVDFQKVFAEKEHLLDDKKQDPEDQAKENSKRDPLISHLFRIQKALSLYIDGNVHEFLRTTDFKVKDIASKKLLKKNIADLQSGLEGKSIKSAIELAESIGICRRDDSLIKFEHDSRYLYDRVTEVPFSDFKNLYNYLEGHTPFSTQHKTKGDEFDCVLVILDNGSWNEYNFNYLFLGNGTPSVLEKTRKIFYVCCTRSKESLAVFFHAPSDAVIVKATEWFGKENVVDLDQAISRR